MKSLVALLVLLAVPFVIGTTAAPESPDGERVLRFRDSAIVESSGLVVDDGLLVTTNDSGDRGRVFVVDADGVTVGVTSWSDEPEDVEALAPAGPGEVWVGDIGDNPAERASVAVSRVPVGRGDRTVTEPSYRLVYPDGPHDAEALLSHPTTGQLYIVSKVVFGGAVYRAPAELSADRDNRMDALGDVVGLVTDGAFLPDGRHLVLRTYSQAVVYTFPGLDVVREIDLPRQEQGEGLAVVGDTLWLTSEGLHAPVLRVPLPGDVVESTATPVTPGDPPDPPPAEEPVVEREPWRWWLGGAVLLLVVIVLLRALRPR